MALILSDRVRETTTTTGTGAFSLGGAITGYQAFSAVLANGDTTYYACAGQGTSEWEVGIGTWNTGNTLSRTTILASSNSGSAVTFSAGTKDIFITYTAAKVVIQDASGNVGIGTSSPSVKLTVAGSTKIGLGVASNSATLMVNNLSGSATGIQLFQDGVESWIMGMPASSAALTWANSGVEQMRLTSTGLGIGTSSPGVKLDVTTATAGFYAARIFNTSITGYGLKIKNGIDSNDALRISNAADSADNILMYGSGNAYFAGSVSAGAGIGARGASISVSGSTDSSPIAAKSGSYATVFGVLPHSNSWTYLSTGVYYQNGVWTHASANTNSALLGLSGNNGGAWWASSNSSASWNLASAVGLWNASGRWVSDVTAPVDVRAPIFYDSNDTSYYGDFAGNSVFYYANYKAASGGSNSNGVPAIKIAGLSNYDSLELGIQDNYIAQIRTYGNDIYYYAGHWRTGGSAATENHSHKWFTSKSGSTNWNVQKMELNHDGDLGIGVSPGYRLDLSSGASGAKMFRMTASGTGRYLYGYADSGGTGITNSDPYTGGTLLYMSGSVTYLYSGGSIGGEVNGSSFRSSIFYDRDNTAYYGDFASTSNINALSVAAINNLNPAHSVWHTSSEGKQRFFFASNSTTYYRTGQNFVWRNNADSGVATLDANGWLRVASGGDNFASYQLHVDGTGYASSDFRAPIFYDSNNTAYYGDFASVSLLSGLDVYGGGLYDDQTGFRLPLPGQAAYATSASSVTGAIKVRIPTAALGSNTMCAFTVSVYTYDGLSFDIRCGGYNYSDASKTWYNVFAYMTSASRGALNVRFGWDGTSQCIWIGELGTSWSYPQVTVRDFMGGYSGFTGPNWRTNWSVSFEATSFYSVSQTATVYPLPYTSNNTGDIYTPRLYDSNNTAYYVDPASTSNINALVTNRSTGTISLANAAIQIENPSSQSSIYFSFSGAAKASLRVDSGGSYVMNSNNADFYFNNDFGPSTINLYAVGTKFMTATSDYATGMGSLRAPIFYDSNNTAYYGDFASTSVFNVLNTGDIKSQGQVRATGWIGTYSGNYDGYAMEMGWSGGEGYLLAYSRSAAAYGVMNFQATDFEFFGHSGGFASINTSFRAPIFYDSNNTAYYGDFASISKVVQIDMASYLRRTTSAAGYLEGWYGTATDSNSSMPIYTIGGSYQPGTTSLGNMYGVGYTYGTGTTNPGLGISEWGLYVASNGTSRIFLGSDTGIGVAIASWRAPIFYDRDNTAFYTDPASTSVVNNVQITTLGVGTAASGTTGEIRATNNVTAYYSDERLKTRLGLIDNALDKLLSLEGFYYEANEVAQALGYTPVREVGVSAQAVQKILPEVVAPAPIDDKYLTVRYEKLVPLLIEAIKELSAKVDELQKRN